MNNPTFSKICYLALLLILSGFLALAIASSLSDRIDAGAIKCNSEIGEILANNGANVVLLSFVTLVPVLLAIAGVFFALVNLWKILKGDI